MLNSEIFNYIKRTDKSNEEIEGVNELGLSKKITKRVYSISFEEFKDFLRQSKPEKEAISTLFFLVNTNNLLIVDYFIKNNTFSDLKAILKVIIKTGKLELVRLLTGKHGKILDEVLEKPNDCLEIVELSLNNLDLFIEIFKNHEWQLIDALKLKMGKGFKDIAKLNIEDFAKVNSMFNLKSYFEIYKIRLSANYKFLIWN